MDNGKQSTGCWDRWLSTLVSAILVAGDEVLQWNGKSLPGATKKEVYNIILESKAEPQVEIVVSRPIGWECTQWFC